MRAIMRSTRRLGLCVILLDGARDLRRRQPEHMQQELRADAVPWQPLEKHSLVTLALPELEDRWNNL
jgi:hypothetical protein